MKIVVRPLYVKRESLEHWLEGMARQGWHLQEFSYLVFQGFASFQFQKGSPKDLRYAIGWIHVDEERAFWQDAGWALVCEKDRMAIYQCESSETFLPIVKQPKRMNPRFLDSILNLCFLFVLLHAFGMEESANQRWLVLLSCFFFLTLPLMIHMKGSVHEMRILRICKNIGYAIVFALLFAGFALVVIHTVQFYFGVR